MPGSSRRTFDPTRPGPGRAPAAALALSLGLGGALVGCAGHTPPTLMVRDVALVEQSAEGYVLRFVLDAQNPNPQALPMRGVEYTFWLDGRRVFSGSRDAEATLRRYGTQEIELPVSVALVPGASVPGGESGPVPYRISGRAVYELPGAVAETLFDSGVRRPSVRFSDRGRLDFSVLGAPPAPAPPASPSSDAGAH